MRVADLDIPHGVQPDMRDHGYEIDDWPDVQQQVFDANGGTIVTGSEHGIKHSR